MPAPRRASPRRIELVVWAIPLLTIMLLGGVAWIASHELDPAQPIASTNPPLQVQAVSLDWKWLFIYPAQHIATVNQLIIPAATPIVFSLTSGSVMNAFFIPQLGSMIYVMNGMTSHLNLQADRPGEFRGMSSHFSGDGFADMHFVTRALPPDQFAAWAHAARSTGPSLDATRYIALAQPSENVPPAIFSAVDPVLFQQIVSQKLPPGPGLRTDTVGQTVSPRSAP